MPALKAQCRCGEIELRISGEPLAQLFCHCDDCQAAHDAAYVMSSVYPADAVEVVRGEPSPRILKRTPRMRCVACGTHLFSEITRANARSVNAYLLPKESFRPQFHVQCAYAVRPIVDDLPHFRDFPAAFFGSDERVGW